VAHQRNRPARRGAGLKLRHARLRRKENPDGPPASWSGAEFLTWRRSGRGTVEVFANSHQGTRRTRRLRLTAAVGPPPFLVRVNAVRIGAEGLVDEGLSGLGDDVQVSRDVDQPRQIPLILALVDRNVARPALLLRRTRGGHRGLDAGRVAGQL